MNRAAFCILAWLIGATAPAADPTKTAVLNQFRAENARAALAYSDRLEEAAARHASDMASARFFSHDGSDGSTVGDRVRATGYGWCVVAENIAQGQPDLTEVMEAWAASPGHRRNMLSREVTDFALVEGPGYIWVMVLARPGC
jgi:uncharacterized protein YkwD